MADNRINIFIENGCHELANMGDIAMLQAAVNRLKRLWPSCHIAVSTSKPGLLEQYCPQATPVAKLGQDMWFDNSHLLGKMSKVIPGFFARGLRRYMPQTAHKMVSRRVTSNNLDGAEFERYWRMFDQADIFVLSGSGLINDMFAIDAGRALALIELADRAGKMTVLLGQGIGPLRNARLAARARAILPKVTLLSLREDRFSKQWLALDGKGHENITVTGDEAIETAYNYAPDALGDCIGINLRVSSYSHMGSAQIEQLSQALGELNNEYPARLIALPISFYKDGSDVQSICRILENQQQPFSTEDIAVGDPAQLMRRVSQCRVVITGSYHPAVFALSQGISVVAISNSEYYFNKFTGLSAQFGCGCRVIDAGTDNLARVIHKAARELWQSAEYYRPLLLHSARVQIRACRAVYYRLARLKDTVKTNQAKSFVSVSKCS